MCVFTEHQATLALAGGQGWLPVPKAPEAPRATGKSPDWNGSGGGAAGGAVGVPPRAVSLHFSSGAAFGLACRAGYWECWGPGPLGHV